MKNAIIGTVLLLVVAAEAAFGCSLAALQLQKVSPDLRIVITHQGKPIAGIQVQVAPDSKANEPVFTALTDEHGTVRIRGLAVGRYYLTASHLDFEAGKEWIEVVAAPGAKIKRRFEFQWASSSYQIRRVAGALTGLVQGNTGNKLMDLARANEAVHPGVNLTLQNAFSDEKYRTVSDSNGLFVIEPVPAGIYMMTIAGGAKSVVGVADETRLIVDVTPAATVEFLPLLLQDVGFGRTEYQLRRQR